MSLTVGSLFSGAGLLDYGLEQAGLETVWQVEYDDWCREVALPQNFPHTEKFKDVREVGKHNLKPVDCIVGGFPCQDVSGANQINAKGLDGGRSGLWSEMFRIICELQPRYALIENVARLAVSGLDRVLTDLASIRLDAEWQTLQASAFGLPHQRDRLFIIAYPEQFGLETVSFKRISTSSFAEPEASEKCRVFIESLGRSYPQIPEHLRVDDGIAYELSEIKKAVKSYGNGVAVPIGKWLGEQIIRFDGEIKAIEQTEAIK